MASTRQRHLIVNQFIDMLNSNDRTQADRARRNAAISQLARQAQDATRQRFWDGVEMIAVVAILAAVELVKNGAVS